MAAAHGIWLSPQMDIEIILQPDGTILVPRGDHEQNEVLLHFLGEVKNGNELKAFLSAGENSEDIFGEKELCG